MGEGSWVWAGTSFEGMVVIWVIEGIFVEVTEGEAVVSQLASKVRGIKNKNKRK